MRILITGGTGSFGQALVQRLSEELDLEKSRVVVFSRDELKQSEMARRFPGCRYFIGDVRDLPRLKMAMRDIDFVVHAAALKQVPAAEYNPFEAIHTNVLGAENVIQAAVHNGVSKVIALSTDKAVNPINLYGASKLAAEKCFIAGNNLSGSVGTRFSVVRYGNVLGSRGSVIPYFRQLIAEGHKALPLTDAGSTRFWLSLDTAINLVAWALGEMHGGEIFVPQVPSARMDELAAALAPDLPQYEIGMRWGEKLHETLISEGDARTCKACGDCYVVEPAFAQWSREPIKGIPVDPDFRYTSDTNPKLIRDRKGLERLLEAA